MSHTRILHVIDDQKFISSCRETFDLEGIENIFSTAEELDTKIQSGDFDILIVHFLRTSVAQKIYKNRPNVPMVWFFWGGDAFSMGKFYNTFLTSKSRRARIEAAFRTSLKSGLKNLFKDLIPQSVDWGSKMRLKIEVMSYFDWIVPIIPPDFDLLCKSYPIKGKAMHLNYISPSFEIVESIKPGGTNILLGNSASVTNNHLDAIDMLKGVDLGGRKIFIPLSYGNEIYASIVSEYAQKHLHEKVYPIMDFMPFDQYSDLLSSCNVLVLNHYRQQALGNVVHAFMSGMRVCLSSKSALYNYLLDLGFSITALDSGNLSLDGLDERQQGNNRKLCIEHFGAAKQHERVRKLMALVTNSSGKNKA